MLGKHLLGIYEKALDAGDDWYQRMEKVRELGFDFLEISIDETDERLSRLYASDEKLWEIQDAARKAGVYLQSLCLSGHRRYPFGSADPDIRRKAADIMERALVFADKMGIRVIQLAGYDVYYEEGNEQTKKLFSENLKKATEMAAKKGILLGFETMETEFMNTVQKSMEYVKMVDSVYLNVYPDLGNITNAAKTYGKDVLDDLETGRGRLVAMHLKETVPNKFREIPFGTGHVDFEAGIKKAWDLGVRRYVTEFWYTGNPEWEKDMDFAVSMMTKILDKQ